MTMQAIIVNPKYCTRSIGRKRNMFLNIVQRVYEIYEIIN